MGGWGGQELWPRPRNHGGCKTQSEIRTVTNGLVLAGAQLETRLHRETSLSAATPRSARLGDLRHQTTPCPRTFGDGTGWFWQDGEAWLCWGGVTVISPAGTLPFQPKRVPSVPKGDARTPRAGDVSAQAARSPSPRALGTSLHV